MPVLVHELVLVLVLVAIEMTIQLLLAFFISSIVFFYDISL